MNREELVKYIAERNHITNTKADEALQSVLDAIKDELTENRSIRIRGFGVFRPVLRKEREARGFMGSGSVTIPERWRVKFSPARRLDEEINYALHNGEDMEG